MIEWRWVIPKYSIIKKEPVAWITLFVTLLLGVINSDRIMSYFDGKVTATIASAIDNYGRCIDKEILIENTTNKVAKNVRISFDFDYIAESGDVIINYGDEKAARMTSVSKTIINRRKYYPVQYEFENDDNVVVIPALQPKQYLHLFFEGEISTDKRRAEAREKLIKSKTAGFMNKPRVASIHYDGGYIEILRVPKHNCRDRQNSYRNSPVPE